MKYQPAYLVTILAKSVDSNKEFKFKNPIIFGNNNLHYIKRKFKQSGAYEIFTIPPIGLKLTINLDKGTQSGECPIVYPSYLLIESVQSQLYK